MLVASLIIFSVCRTKYRQPSSTPTPKISQMVDTSDFEDCIFAIESVGAICHNHQNQYSVSLKFMHSGRNTVIKCQSDAGATCNVMSYTDLCVQQSNNPRMLSTTTRLKFYNNDTVCALGECTLCCQYKRSNYYIHFKIIPGTQNPLLSGSTCQALDLIPHHILDTIRKILIP